MTLTVVKRDGRREPLNLDKFHRVTMWACEGLSTVSASEIQMRSQIQFYNGMKTSEIQETLIKAAADLISEDAPGYQYVAGQIGRAHV